MVPVAMVQEQCIRFEALRVLFDNGARGAEVDSALIKAVVEGPNSQPTIDLLLDNGASVNIDGGQAVKIAARNGHHSILTCLLNQNINPAWRLEAIDTTMRTGGLDATSRL